MPKTVIQKLKCPYCPYEPWSEADKEAHIKFTHGGSTADTKAPDSPAATPPKEAEVPAPPAANKKAEVVPEPVPADEPKYPAGIFVPSPQPDFWVSEQVVRELYIIAKLSKKGEIVNFKLLGPAGVGKTSLGYEFAAANHRPCFEINWGRYSEPGQVWGKDELSMTEGTFYSATAYKDALETPNCVIINDEANRCHPDVLNANLDLWDWRRAAYVPELKRQIRVAPGVTFIATMNEGGEYIGTNPLDRAIRERFTRTIRMAWPPMKVEAGILQKRTNVDKDVAVKLATFARDVRRNPKVGCAPSTRQLLVCAQDVAEGLPIQEAVMYSIINDLDETADRQSLLQHLQVIGKVDEAYVNGGQQDDDDK